MGVRKSYALSIRYAYRVRGARCKSKCRRRRCTTTSHYGPAARRLARAEALSLTSHADERATCNAPQPVICKCAPSKSKNSLQLHCTDSTLRGREGAAGAAATTRRGRLRLFVYAPPSARLALGLSALAAARCGVSSLGAAVRGRLLAVRATRCHGPRTGCEQAAGVTARTALRAHRLLFRHPPQRASTLLPNIAHRSGPAPGPGPAPFLSSRPSRVPRSCLDPPRARRV